MFKTFPLVATISAALLAAPALATPTGAPDGARIEAAAAPVVAPAKRETRYCVVETLTGSRIPHKECHTRKEWIDLSGRDPLDSE